MHRCTNRCMLSDVHIVANDGGLQAILAIRVGHVGSRPPRVLKAGSCCKLLLTTFYQHRTGGYMNSTLRCCVDARLHSYQNMLMIEELVLELVKFVILSCILRSSYSAVLTRYILNNEVNQCFVCYD